MKKLEWDSKFWGIDIFSIPENNKVWNQDVLSSIKDSGKLWLIQGLISENEVGVINSLENEGFRFVESIITCKNKITIKASISENQFKEIEKYELEEYKNEFFNLFGKYSRFFLFGEKKINDFYYTWLINSIDGKMDDKCIGYYLNSQLAGFVTYKYDNNRMKLGLLGVFQKFQQKGISQKLLGYVNNVVLNEELSEMILSTQGKNIKAINAYIKNGFIFENIKQWYYLTNCKDLQFTI